MFETCGRINLRNSAPRSTFSFGPLSLGWRISVYKRRHHLRELTVESSSAWRNRPNARLRLDHPEESATIFHILRGS